MRNLRKSFRLVSLSFFMFVLFVGTPLMCTVSAVSVPLTFGPIQNLSNNATPSSAPVIASVGLNVYVAWVDGPIGHQESTFVSSNNGGATWNPIITFNLPGKAHDEEMVAEGSYVFLSWQQNGFIMFASSPNNGTSFNTPMNMSAFQSTSPIIRASGPNVYLTWIKSPRNGIYIAVSRNYGQSFGAPKDIIPGGQEQEVAVEGSNNVYVVSDAILFTYSHNNGTNFSPPVHINIQGFSGTKAGREPMISAVGSFIYVTWTANTYGPYEAYVAISNDSGLSFAAPKDVSGTFGSAREIQVDSSLSNVYVTFRGQVTSTSNVNQFITVSNDNGKAFSAPTDLGNQTKSQGGFGGVIANGTYSYTMWPHAAKGGIAQMFFEASQDGGTTWAGVQQLSSSTGGITGMADPGDSGPMFSVGGSHVYAVWQDNSTGNGDIYFRVST